MGAWGPWERVKEEGEAERGAELNKNEKNGILNFAGKWMELENIILSEVTQTQKDNYHMYSLISGF